MTHEIIRRIPSALGGDESGLTPFQAGRGNKLYEHPTSPDRLIRWENFPPREAQALPYFKKLLDDLETRYGIPHVHPQFAISAEPISQAVQWFKKRELSDIDVIAVTDKVHDAHPARDILAQESIEPAVAHEFDLLSQRLISHLRDVYGEGGFHCQELYYYDQYVYSDSAPKGKKLVLVDIEPLGFFVHPKPYERIPGTIPIELVEVVADMTKDVLTVEQKTGRQLAAGAEIIDFIESVDSQGITSMEEAKMRIVAALESGDTAFLEVFTGQDEGILSSDWRYDSSVYIGTALEKGLHI